MIFLLKLRLHKIIVIFVMAIMLCGAGIYLCEDEVQAADDSSIEKKEGATLIYGELSGYLEMVGASEDFPAVVGDVLTLNATATSGKGGYTYMFVVENVENGGKYVFDYSTSSSVRAKVSAASRRKYTLFIKDSSGNEVEADSITIDIVEHQLTVDGSLDDIKRLYGETVSMKVRSSVNDTYTYKYTYEDLNTGVEHVLLDYSNQSSYECTFNDLGKKKLTVYAKDSSGNIVETNSIIVSVYEKPLSVEFEFIDYTEDMKAYYYDEVPCKVTVEGGSESYKYFFLFMQGDSRTVQRPYNSMPTDILMTETGEVSFYLRVWDSDDNYVESNTVTLNVADYRKLEGTFEVDGIEWTYMDDEERYIAIKGNDLTLNATASNGSGGYTYKYVVENVETGVQVVVKDYSDSTSVVAKISSQSIRKYTVYIKDSDGNIFVPEPIIVYICDSELDVSFWANGVSDNAVSIVGEEVKMEVKATGGTGEYKYYCEVESSDLSETFAEFINTKDSVWTWRPNRAGTYNIYMVVRDSYGQRVDESIRLTVKEEIKGTLNIDGVKKVETSSSTEYVALMGANITLNASATGGFGDYTYKYEVENITTGKKTTIKDYSEDTSVECLLDFADTDNYASKYTVYVKDSKGFVVKTNSVIVDVYKKNYEAILTANGYTDGLIITLGEEVTFEIQAVIESDIYTYYSVISSDESLVCSLLDDSIFKWTPDVADTYDVYAIVKDCFENQVYTKCVHIKVVREPGLYKAEDGKWYYYVNDEIDTSYTGLAKNAYGWWYVKSGTVDFTFTGLTQYGSAWWYVKAGKLDTSYTGLEKNQYGTWYVEKGKVNLNVSGIKNVGTTWAYLTKGKVDTTFTGLAQNSYGWWYVKAGILDFTYTGLGTNKYGTWYVEKGKVNQTVSGLTKVGSSWAYLTKGKVDTTFTGLAQNSYGWWYVKAGILDFTYTGLGTNKYGTWYVEKGKVNQTVSGLTKVGSSWVYLTKGKVDTTFTGLTQNHYGWWYIAKGKLDTSYTGVSKNAYGYWYVKNGKVDQSYNGPVKYNGVAYTVTNGKVNIK